jgi:hypothetical protein
MKTNRSNELSLTMPTKLGYARTSAEIFRSIALSHSIGVRDFAEGQATGLREGQCCAGPTNMSCP